MWKNKYFIIMLIVCLVQLCNFIFSIVSSVAILTIVFSGLVLLFVTLVLCKIVYDLHTEGWEEL